MFIHLNQDLNKMKGLPGVGVPAAPLAHGSRPAIWTVKHTSALGQYDSDVVLAARTIVHDDLAPNGDFTSSDDLLNQLHIASVFTMLNNVHSIPTDCPTLEKSGWSGDAMLAAEMFLTNFDSSDLLAKHVQDLHDSLTDGPPAVNALDSGWGANKQADPRHSAFILIPAWIYAYRGDTRVLSDNYKGMRQYIEFELGRSSTQLGDWDTPETSPLGGNPPEDSPATAFLYHMMDTMSNVSNVATVLGNTADASTFAYQAAAIKNSFNSAFLNHSTGYYTGIGDSGYRQWHNLLALAFGLTPNTTTAQVVADSVAADVTARGGHLNTRALDTKQILPMLTEHGRKDTALVLAQQTTYPGSGYWTENGATTTWEHWLFTARSHDYWTLAPFGNLTVSWTNASGTLSLNVGIPVGVTATVSFTAGA
ncbi:bacterial alpha-L-rhamnosidase-domain-containing protein [Mycena pura]|uniref:alpha-L-rhamnosidase n=1 Tax=Mycena pura TaxID=153505 RepID=A0AAD6USI1_9AGAR|nr:bacterial alpha-L-rhamnosidase-domain-containing protein [Mycena pura]